MAVKGQTKLRKIGQGSSKVLSLAEVRSKAMLLKAEAKEGRDMRGTCDHRETTFEDAGRALNRDKDWIRTREL